MEKTSITLNPYVPRVGAFLLIRILFWIRTEVSSEKLKVFKNEAYSFI
ncbi:hypothetical protein NRS6085_17360 [Bacillus subtilis]|nr:hypothetical protein NRS6085_03686 [Bacillus subtilis]CAF1871240.1 hypothetical protein NRS6181_03766 [Bacillus subtilis]CAI6248147.1 hypothetical protein NRS6181_06415 [Bacillus subtilis]CAI6306006.1 hypothetical protein NRS6085_17360 [Bacillus subtilis]